MILKLSHDNFELRIESTTSMSCEDPKFADLVRYLHRVEAAAPVAEVKFSSLGGGTYQYKVTRPGAVWTQTIVVAANPDDTTMTYDVPQGWKCSQHEPLRPVRAWLLAGVPVWGLTLVKATWV